MDGRLEVGGQPVLNEQVRLETQEARAVKGGGNTDAEVLQYYTYASEKGDVTAVETMGQLQFYGARGMPQARTTQGGH